MARQDVEEEHAGRAAALLVVHHAVHDAVRSQREPPRRAGRRERDADAVEVRMRDAAALAGPAVMTRRAAAMRCGEDGDPADRDDPLAPEPLGDAVPDILLGAVQGHGRQELAVRELRQAERFARDPDELLHVVVPRRDVGVADRPVDAEAVPRIRLEVQVAPAVHLPAPHDGLTAHLAAADPVERLVGIEGVWVVAVVHEELAAVLVAGIAVALDELIVLERLAVAEPAELHLPRRHVLDVITRRIDRPSGLEHERLEPALAQLLGGPPARNAGPYDDGVEAGGGHQKSPGDARQRPSSVHPLYEPGIAS